MINFFSYLKLMKLLSKLHISFPWTFRRLEIKTILIDKNLKKMQFSGIKSHNSVNI